MSTRMKRVIDYAAREHVERYGHLAGHFLDNLVDSIKLMACAEVERVRDSGRLPKGEKPKALSAKQARAAPEEGHRP